MPNLIFTIDGATSNRFFRVSSHTKTDKYPFAQVAGRSDQHQIVFTKEEWEKDKDSRGRNDFPLTLRGCPYDVSLEVEITDADRDNGEALEDLRKEAEETAARHQKEIDELHASLQAERDRANEIEKSTPGAKLSAEHRGYLLERDDLIKQLLPYVEDEEHDTPITVLSRILTQFNAMKTNPATPDPMYPETVKDEEPEPTVGGDDTAGIDPQAGDSKGTGFEPEDADLAIATGDTNPGPPVSVGGDDQTEENPALGKQPEPLAFHRKDFDETLKHRDLAELHGLAAPLGIPGYAQLTKKQLRKAIGDAEEARHAVGPEQAPHNIARPDGEQIVDGEAVVPDKNSNRL